MRLAWSLVPALVALALVGLAIGSVAFTPAELIEGLRAPSSLAGIILYDIRLPRLVLALLIGAALGASGAALQGLLRNPLAEPSVLGAPQMAALGAAGAIFLGGAGSASHWVASGAIGLALFSVAVITIFAGRTARMGTVLVVGLALGSLAGALLSLLLAMAENPFALAEIVFWMIGSLEDRSWHHVALAGPPILLGLALLLSAGDALRALVLGDETAHSMGIDLARLRWQVAFGVALAVGGTVAVAGAIGFVGLLAPHLVRALAGPDPGRLLLPSALAGSLVVLCADIVARLIPSPTEIKVGMVTALVGVPAFILVLVRNRDMVEGEP